MSLLNEIKRDMEKGSPGPWEKCEQFLTVSPSGGRAICEFWLRGNDAQERADANRTVRIPDMEKALLAAEELAHTLDADMGRLAFSPATMKALAAFRAATE